MTVTVTSADRLAAVPGAAPTVTPPGRSGESFQRALAAAAGDGAAAQRRETLRETAVQFVSSALVLPVLQSLRDGSLSPGGPFAPGPAERRFGPLLDTHLADRITRGARWPLVDAIVGHIERTAGREVRA